MCGEFDTLRLPPPGNYPSVTFGDSSPDKGSSIRRPVRMVTEAAFFDAPYNINP